jgi:hypothetical protein
MSIHFEINSASETVLVGNEGGKVITHRKLALTMRADNYAKIDLSNGRPINHYDVHFSLSTKCRTAKDIDADLNDDEIGFLVYSDNKSEIFIHGSAVWPHDTFIDGICNPDVKVYLSLTLANQEVVHDYAPSITWKPHRDGAFRLSALDISVVRNKAESDAED